MYKKYFCTFADSRMKSSLKRIKKQAEDLDYFGGIFIYNEDNLDLEFREYFKDKLIKGSRGYGYWVWKPQIILQTFRKMNEGDILLYTDAGCHLNKKGLDRLNYYFKQAEISESGLFVFQEAVKPINPDLEFAKINLEKNYTKGDVFDYYNARDKKNISDTGQTIATAFLIKKCHKSESLVKNWLKIFKEEPGFIDDSPSITPNLVGFKENRHDQSIFSMLCKLNNVPFISSSEVWQPDWDKLALYPILAKRDKDLSFFWRLHRKIYSEITKKNKILLYRKNLIIKIKRNKNIYLLVRMIYYFFFQNKALGKILWLKSRYIHSHKTMVYEPCLCGNKDYTIYLNQGKHKVISCTKCNLLRNFPKPDNGIYEENMSEEYENNPELSIQVKEIFKNIKNSQNQDINILDFGCGDGRAMLFLKNMGFKNIYGLEISTHLSAKAKDKGLNIFNNIDLIPKNIRFDYILSNHVFEHIQQLNEELIKIKDLMKKDGLLVTFVPNIRASTMHNAFINLLWDTHYWQFSPDTLGDVFKRNFFGIVDCQTMSDKRNEILMITPPTNKGLEGDVIYIKVKKC